MLTYRRLAVLMFCAAMLAMIVGGQAEAGRRSRRAACPPVYQAVQAQRATLSVPTPEVRVVAMPPAAEVPAVEVDPTPAEKPPLPEGVTEVTKEDLLQRIPNFFSYDYMFEPEPGKRYWLRVSTTRFLERYPSGLETQFEIVGRTTAEGLEGTVTARLLEGGKRDAFELFIADRTLEARRLFYRTPEINEGKWVYLGDIKNVD